MTILDLTVGTCTVSLKIKKNYVTQSLNIQMNITLIWLQIVTTNYVIFNLMKNDNRSKQCAYYTTH